MCTDQLVAFGLLSLCCLHRCARDKHSTNESNIAGQRSQAERAGEGTRTRAQHKVKRTLLRFAHVLHCLLHAAAPDRSHLETDLLASARERQRCEISSANAIHGIIELIAVRTHRTQRCPKRPCTRIAARACRPATRTQEAHTGTLSCASQQDSNQQTSRSSWSSSSDSFSCASAAARAYSACKTTRKQAFSLR
jgi:hypothetical protein